MTDEDEKPVVVNSNAAPGQLSALVRYSVVLLGGLGFLPHFLTEDQIEFLKSDTFITCVSALATVGGLVWSQFSAWRKRQLLVDAANAAPNSRFVVEKVSTVKAVVSGEAK